MEEKKFELTQTDVNAIKHNDSNYINNKGANFYREKIMLVLLNITE